MKLYAAALGLLAAHPSSSALATADSSALRPVRVRYEDVISPTADDGSALSSMMDALSDVGMVSITGFPASFDEDRRAIQTSLEACAGRSVAVRAHVFGDGTKWTTRKCRPTPLWMKRGPAD